MFYNLYHLNVNVGIVFFNFVVRNISYNKIVIHITATTMIIIIIIIVNSSSCCNSSRNIAVLLYNYF